MTKAELIRKSQRMEKRNAENTLDKVYYTTFDLMKDASIVFFYMYSTNVGVLIAVETLSIDVLSVWNCKCLLGSQTTYFSVFYRNVISAEDPKVFVILKSDFNTQVPSLFKVFSSLYKRGQCRHVRGREGYGFQHSQQSFQGRNQTQNIAVTENALKPLG